jgi:hypothetical protein
MSPTPTRLVPYATYRGNNSGFIKIRNFISYIPGVPQPLAYKIDRNQQFTFPEAPRNTRIVAL